MLSFQNNHLNNPEMLFDSDEESVIAAFFTADIGSSELVIKIISQKIKETKKTGKKNSYVGDICTFFITKDNVVIRDNNMLFEHNVSYSCSFQSFLRLFEKWKKFIKLGL